MDFQRLFLFLILSFSLMMVWDGWQRYQHPQPAQIAAVQKSDLPTAIAPNSVTAVSDHAGIVQLAEKGASGKVIRVKTDLMDIEINTLGGDIQHLLC